MLAMLRCAASLGLLLAGVSSFRTREGRRKVKNVDQTLAAVASPRQIVDERIASHSCMIFGKSYCGWTRMAKGILLDDLQANCHVMNIDVEVPEDVMNAMQDYLLEITGERTVPRVFIGGKSIGGASDTRRLHEAGELRGLLEEAGALTKAVALASSPRQIVRERIASHSCMIFGKSYCGWTRMAKGILLNDLQANCHVMDIDVEVPEDVMNAMQDYLLEITGERTVPRVFIGGFCIGGASDTRRLHETGELRGLLEEAGALTKAVASASSPRQIVDERIASHSCMIFGKSYCGWTRMAKGILLDDLQANCHVMNIDVEVPEDVMNAMQDYLLEMTGERTVPRVFIGGKSIGGASDTRRLHEAGELRGLLEKAGAV